MIDFIPLAEAKISDETWDSFISNSDNGTIFHEKKFLGYHTPGKFEDASLTLVKEKKLFSLLPAVVIKRENQKILSSHSGSSYGGFVYNDDLTLKDAFALAEAAETFAKQIDCKAVQLTIPPIIYSTKYSNYIDFALYRSGYSYLKREVSSIVQLDNINEDILNTFRSEARTATKKAIASGVVIKETDRFEEYYEILKKNLKLRHNVNPTHTLDELLAIKKLYPDRVRLWGAFLEDELIAGVCNFSANKKIVLAFYISHNEAFQFYRPVNLLFYEIMKKYKEEGFNFLDFGIFTVNMEPNWGLGRFKENFGARGIFRDTFIKKI